MEYVRNVIIGLDRFLNCLLFAGIPDQTISFHAARKAEDGKAWACILCRWLSATVEKDHCKKTLSDQQTQTSAGLRALFQMVAVSAIIYYAPLIVGALLH